MLQDVVALMSWQQQLENCGHVGQNYIFKGGVDGGGGVGLVGTCGAADCRADS